MKWIDILNKKPNLNDLIIGINIKNYDIGIYRWKKPTDTQDFKRMENLTHWMLFPELPKDETLELTILYIS